MSDKTQSRKDLEARAEAAGYEFPHNISDKKLLEKTAEIEAVAEREAEIALSADGSNDGVVKAGSTGDTIAPAVAGQPVGAGVAPAVVTPVPLASTTIAPVDGPTVAVATPVGAGVSDAAVVVPPVQGRTEKPIAPGEKFLRVVGPVAGRRRAGRSFGRTPVDIAASDLSDREIEALCSDPLLSVSFL